MHTVNAPENTPHHLHLDPLARGWSGSPASPQKQEFHTEASPAGAGWAAARLKPPPAQSQVTDSAAWGGTPSANTCRACLHPLPSLQTPTQCRPSNRASGYTHRKMGPVSQSSWEEGGSPSTSALSSLLPTKFL